MYSRDMYVEEAAPAPGTVAGRRSLARTARLVLECMRPPQWTKNLFVLGGLVFSGSVLTADALARSLVAFAAFCLASGATYLLNDVLDAEVDRHNPRTAGRPVARGALPRRTALVAAAAITVASLALVAPLGWETLTVLVGFLVLQLAYSTVLKHVILLDVMAIATGFLLRALAGLVVIPVEISEWLLLCTGLLALFLGLAKRRGEVIALGGQAKPSRPVLDDYSLELIDQYITIIAPATVMAYGIYSITAASTSAMVLTVPFVLYGIFRYLYLLHKRGYGERPETAPLRDRGLGLAILGWGLTAAVISYIAN
jgi:4-hydroxybenzoate polyprenyltransferase